MGLWKISRNFEDCPTHVSSPNISHADVSGVRAIVGNKHYQFTICWLYCYKLVCSCMHTENTSDLETLSLHLLLLAHAHSDCFRLRKNRVSRWKVFPKFLFSSHLEWTVYTLRASCTNAEQSLDNIIPRLYSKMSCTILE